MKYIVYFVLIGIIFILVSPIISIKWDDKGWDEVVEGLQEICGVDN